MHLQYRDVGYTFVLFMCTICFYCTQLLVWHISLLDAWVIVSTERRLIQSCLHYLQREESAPFFIPSTSFCSLSWFTSSCAYHLITVTTHYSILIFTVRCTTVQSAVRLSVTLVDCDYIGWNSSKIVSWLVSVGRSLFADPNTMDLLQGEQPEMWAQSDPPPVDFSVGDIRSQI